MLPQRLVPRIERVGGAHHGCAPSGRPQDAIRSGNGHAHQFDLNGFPLVVWPGSSGRRVPGFLKGSRSSDLGGQRGWSGRHPK